MNRDIREIISQARSLTRRGVNSLQVISNYVIGMRIFREERSGQERADYGKSTLKELSGEPTKEFGRGYSRSNLEYMRYLIYAPSRVSKKMRAEDGAVQPITACSRFGRSTALFQVAFAALRQLRPDAERFSGIRRIPASICILVNFLYPSPLFASIPRPAYFSRPAEIVLPAGFSRNREYPVFVVLPPTGVEAVRVPRWIGLDPERQGEFILILPAGAPTREEYLPDFRLFIRWYEQRLLADLQYVFDNYRVDRQRVYLGGYSLGGDLSWALSVRNPDIFSGAVMAGTRASYPPDPEALARMKERGFRGVFLIGNREDPNRYRGINNARSLFETAGIEHRYREYPGAHIIPSSALFQDSIAYVTGARGLPDPFSRVASSGNSGETGTAVSRISPGSGTARPPGAPGLLSHTSRDRFALGGKLPADLGFNGIEVPYENEFTLRAEWPWQASRSDRQFYLRSILEFSGSGRTTDWRDRRIRQEVLFGTGGGSGNITGPEGGGRPDPGDRADLNDSHSPGPGFFGMGIGWDWIRAAVSTENPGDLDGDFFREIDLIFFRADRSLWIIPAGKADPDRIDSLLLLRYTLPRGLIAGGGFSGIHGAQLLNLRGEYLLRIADSLVIDAGLGSWTVQNAPVDSLKLLPEALDHRVQWDLGIGIRVPSAVIWRAGYRGIAERPLSGSGMFSYRGAFSISVELSW